MDTVTPQPIDNVNLDAIKKANKRKIIWGLICIIGPSALLILTVMFFAVINLIFADVQASAIKSALNVVGFIIGAVSVLALLPGVIIGIILLAMRQPLPPNA